MLDGQDATPGHNAAPHRDMANAIRALAMDAVQLANSGHPGMPMGMADVATVLFTQAMKYDAADPVWPDRDRFVLSAGHGSMLLYALLYLTGGPGITIENIRNFRQLHSCTAGHPEYRYIPGIETTTGPLGQGITTAVGMAIAERLMNARFGDALVDHMTWVIAGDGCLMEGISHEAIDLAGHLRLGRLCVLWDDNSISIDGATSLSTSMDQGERFAAAGWQVIRIDGHDAAAIAGALEQAKGSDRPTFIGCKTIIGYGAPNKQGTAATHGAPLGAEEIAAARAHLGWSAAPFELPEGVLAAWRAAGQRGAAEHEAWAQRHDALPAAERQRFDDLLMGAVPQAVTDDLAAFKREMAEKRPKLATRKSSEMVLQVINDATEATVGGSADLTHSNYTITKGMRAVTPGDFSGRYIHYGIREHAMAAAMNGIALHGGAIPYGGTFLVFSDYARGAIRLSAIMGVRVLYVLTHDSIGVGEDGPTHQPIEHLAMLRATPNLLVFRPADAIETAECYELALLAERSPSVLAFSRQNVAAVRLEASAENLSAKGAYILRQAGAKRDVTLIATGSEVDMTVAAAAALAAEGIYAAVVSMPCWELFEQQSDAYQQATLGTAPRICIEAAARFGWDRWMGERGVFIGMKGFGESGPGDQVYAHFGITREAIVQAAKDVVAGQPAAADAGVAGVAEGAAKAGGKPAFRSVDEAEVAGRRVLVRADLNVPMKDGAVTDATRIERLLPTIEALTARHAKVVVMSHFGRPDGEHKPEFTLRPVARKLETLLGRPVAFIDDTIGEGAAAGIARLADGEVAVLENLRFHKGEEKNEPAFAQALASLGDLYVNDAFSVSHRAHASTHGIAALLPAYAGRQMQDELGALSMALDAPKRPVAAIVGGAKVSTKIPVLTHLVDKVDVLIIGGGMANTFLLANGVEVGKSLCEPDLAATVKDIYAQAEKAGCRIVLPTDAVVAREFKAGAETQTVAVTAVPADGMILDIGPASVAEMSGILRDCCTLLWNGPVGAFEVAPFGAGTFALAGVAADLTRETGLVTVAGGGDTVAALNAAGVTDRFTYVSTAGGAFLEWMEGRELPGVAALSAA